MSDSTLYISGVWERSQSHTCWFLVENDPCLVNAASSQCRAPRSQAIQLESSRSIVRCTIPTEIRALHFYRLALEVTFMSGNVTTLRCFSHEHSHTSAADASKLPLVPQTISANATLDALSPLCECIEDIYPCSVRVTSSTTLWCKTSSSCPAALKLGPALASGQPSAHVIPCDGSVPGIPSLSCAATCLGLGCTLDNECVCAAGYSGAACATPICVPACKAEQGVCGAPNTCTCLEGYRGLDCSQPMCQLNCSEQGVCFNPDDCRCFQGFEGDFCEAQSVHRTTSNTRTQVLVAILVSSLIVAVVVIFLLWRIKRARPIMVMQPPPDGAELGPIVSRMTSLERRWFCWLRTSTQTEEFFENASQDAINTHLGLLPTYRESNESQSEDMSMRDPTPGDDNEAPPSYDRLQASQMQAMEGSRTSPYRLTHLILLL